ncbi:MAG: DUF952 domain-containing protein [Gracilimonas sp.]
MDIDLLFAVIKQSEWRKISQEESLKPESFEQDGAVYAFTGEHAEEIINHYFDGSENLLLIVLDPLRIQSPIKRVKQDGFDFIAVQGQVTMDAIIDKIKLNADKKGAFSLNVKHFD